MICSGSRAVLRFNTELQRANDPHLNEAIQMIMNRVDGLPTQHVETKTYDTIKVIDIDGVESPDDKTIA